MSSSGSYACCLCWSTVSPSDQSAWPKCIRLLLWMPRKSSGSFLMVSSTQLASLSESKKLWAIISKDWMSSSSSSCYKSSFPSFVYGSGWMTVHSLFDGKFNLIGSLKAIMITQNASSFPNATSDIFLATLPSMLFYSLQIIEFKKNWILLLMTSRRVFLCFLF